MTNTILTAYIPISIPAEPHDVFETAVCGMLDELCDLSGYLRFPLEDYGSPKATVEGVRDIDKNQIDLEQWIEFGNLNTCEVMKIEVELDIGELHWLNLVNIFNKRVTDLIIAANIAHLGSLELLGGVYFKDDRCCGNIRALNAFSLREVSSFAKRKGWPTLHKLTFDKVWSWATNQPGFLKGFGGGLTGRAINAFTHLFAMNFSGAPIDLFWSMVALEALYVDGKQGIAEQMREKVWTFLGEQDSYKRDITKLYDYRSKFVHGGSDFIGVNSYHLPNDMENIVKYDNGLTEAALLAQAILVATLQELVRRDWPGIGFSYQAKSSEEPAAT